MCTFRCELLPKAAPPSGAFWRQRALPAVRRCRPARVALAHAGPSDVFVLDFDGVLADSQAEVASAGYAAAEQRWPQLFADVDAAERARVMAGLVPTRARLVKGYETMVMARLILESGDAAVAHILRPGWDARGGLLEWSLACWGEDAGELAALFERLRGERVEQDPEGWLAMTPLYPGVKEALADCPYPFYIASSKRGDRLVRLLNGLLGLGVEEGSPRVMASLIPPNERKIEALRSILQRPVAADPSTMLHFVDDRLETLEAIAAAPDLRARFTLYHASWGYTTPEERAAAAAMLGVRPLALPQLCELLRFGLVMDVDDGCEPTGEEARAAVYTPYASAASNE